jgi:hypothetical protein
MHDEEGQRLADAWSRPTDKLAYLYDFGASWQHTIACERVLDLAAGTTYPVCVAGGGDSPVEDWTEGPESKPFDLDATNRRLANLAAHLLL